MSFGFLFLDHSIYCSVPTNNFALLAHLFRQTIRVFEDEFWKASRPNGSDNMIPLTQEDPSWTPVIDLTYHDIQTIAGHTTPALSVVYRKCYEQGRQTIEGRFCLPLRNGLFEVVIEAKDKGVALREASFVADLCGDKVLTTDLLRETLKSHAFDAPVFDDQFPDHCLSRVRAALTWLLTKSELVVTEPTAKPGASTTSDIMLPHLGCMFQPPPRFLLSANTSNPGSNKERLYRVALGSEGVQMMVVSVWHTQSYAANLRKRGTESLRQVARHGAQLIHQSQNFHRIRVTVEDVVFNKQKSWRGSPGGRDAVLTIVDCEESGGLPCQNIIGWVRAEHSDNIYLIYYADTLGPNFKQSRAELLESLVSMRGITQRAMYSRRRSTKSMWNVGVENSELREGAGPS